MVNNNKSLVAANQTATKQKKSFEQLTFQDLAKINKELGNPFNDKTLYWIYQQLLKLRHMKNISVKDVPVTKNEYIAAMLMDNALSKEFAMPDTEIYYYSLKKKIDGS